MTKTHKMIAVDYKNLVQELPIFLATDLTNWEYIDDRYNSFYGSTFEVPVEDYKIDEGFEDKIVIIGDNYLIEDKYTYNTNYIDDIYYSGDIPVRKTREYRYRNFETVLKKVYPNAEIIREEAHNLDDVVNYFMNNMDNYPNYVIFNGAENTYLQTKDYNDVVNKLTILNNIFQSNDIKALLIYTLNYDIMSIDYSDYLNIFYYQYTNIETFDLYRWLENHFELDNSLTWKNLQNKIEKLCDKYNPCISEDGYSIVIHNRIKKAVTEDFFNIHRKHFYISFQYTKVNSDTYYKAVQWKRGSYEASIFGRKYTGTNADSSGLNNELDEFHTIHTPKDVQIHFITKYGTDNHWNLFSNTGEFIAMAIHTSYAEDKYMYQQLQVNCNEEYMYSRGDYLNLMLIRKYATGRVVSELNPIYPPMFPATGCPWLCVSDDNIENYGVQLYRTVGATINLNTKNTIKKSVTSNTNNYKLEKYLPRYCYITQTDKSVTISIELKDCNGKRPTLYESASVGMVEDLQTENYPFPLYACGGSEALKQDIYVYTPIRGNCPTYLTGNVYDLSADNICLSNSNALHPTKFYGSKSSTFKVLSPEGKWYNIFNLVQSALVKPKDTCGGCYPDFKCVLYYPSEYRENNYYPMTYQKKHTSTFDEMKKEEPYLYEPKKHNTKIDKLSICEIIGSIPNHYISYDESLPCGEIFLDNKRYLCMPNIWDMRLWWYQWIYGLENEKWTQEYVRDRFDKIFTPKRYEKINDKLLIRLED